MRILDFSLDIIAPIILAIIGILTYQIVKYLKDNKFLQELNKKKELVEIAVRMCQQLYNDLDGASKYQIAVEWVTDQFNEYGIKTTPDELKGLIESILQRIKQEVNNPW